MPHLDRDRWSLDYEMRPGGVILTDVRHDHFNVARDIRAVRVWVDTEYPQRTDGRNLVSFVLNSPDLPASDGGIDVLEPTTTPGQLVNETPFFIGFNTLFGLRAAYTSTPAYLSGSPNECRIEIAQRFLFTDYGKNPAHEPGGVLDACRLFPMLNFWFPPVTNTSQPYPKYFRADYRLDVSLDNIDERGVEGGVRGPDTTTNKAAIFRDKEDLPGFFGQLFAGLRIVLSPITSGGPNVEEIFAAFEKPLGLEIASWGLLNGEPPPNVTRPDAWDNVHIWPAVRGVRAHPVSTPGAFHAFHCHWRWGAVAGDPDAPGYLLGEAGAPQFTGSGWSVSEGGALVDPGIADQNLRFAITRNDQPEWEAQQNPSERDFFALFTDRRSRPSSVALGDDLVLWLSFEVFRPEAQLGTPWTGNLFVNGFYFAHNQDATPLTVALGGAYGEGAFPPPEERWQRLARRP